MPDRLQPPAKKEFMVPLEWLTALLLTVLIAGFHLYFLCYAGGFWRDEVNLINLATWHSVSDMTKDSFPVLMPLLLKGWVRVGLGGNDLSLRLLGTCIGLGIGGALWLSALGTRRPPLFSLTLFGLNAAAIFYGDSLRAYGLGCLVILLAHAAMLAFLKKPSWSRTGILLIALILSVQVLYQNAVLVAAICLGGWSACLLGKNSRAAVKILTAAMLAAISLLPYWNRISGLSGNVDPLRVGFVPRTVFANLCELSAYPLPQMIYVWGFLAYALAAFTLLGLRAHFSNAPPPPRKFLKESLPVYATVTVLAALIGFIGFLWLAERRTEPWYFLPLAAVVAICFDTGIRLPSLARWMRTSILTAIWVTAITEIALAKHNLNHRFTNADELARQLEKQAAPKDFVIVTPWFCGISFERYCPSNLAWQTIPPLPDHSVHRYDLLSESMETTDALAPLFQKMADTLQAGHRVWVVSANSVGELQIPKPGQPCPTALPPPPLPGSGWAEAPYCANWAAQTAWFLQHHCESFASTTNKTSVEHVSRYESLRLFVADGWKNDPGIAPGP